MNKKAFVSIMAAGIVLFGKLALPGIADEVYKKLDIATKVMRGKVVDISYVDSKITIQEAGEDNKTTFFIIDKTKFFMSNAQGSYSPSTINVVVSASDIMRDDEVAIEYYDNPKSAEKLVARSVELIKK